jgi:hypothetical protein
MAVKSYPIDPDHIENLTFSTRNAEVRKIISESSNERVRALLAPDPAKARRAMVELARDFWR